MTDKTLEKRVAEWLHIDDLRYPHAKAHSGAAELIRELDRELSISRMAAEEEANHADELKAERDRLRAEVERLDACRKAHLLQADDSLHEVMELIHDNEELEKAANIEAMENDHLRAENAALQADAERYRKIFKSAGTDAAIDHIIRQTQIVSQS